jgi:hypothetical protein
MKFLKKLTPLILSGALALSGRAISAQQISLSLFPEVPLYRSALTESNSLNTEINLPGGLEKEVSNKRLNEMLPYTSLAKEIPLFTLEVPTKKIPKIIPYEKRGEAKIRSLIEKTEISDKIVSATLVASGRLKFPDKKPEYTGRAELFIGSPMMDDYLSDGNKFFLTTGINCDGSLNLEGIANRKISSLYKIFEGESYNFFGDAYIIAKSPYSNQMTVLKVGFDNLFGNTKESANFNLSATIELPSMISWIKELKNSKVIPYFSVGINQPLDSSPGKKTAEFGIKATGNSKKAIIGYINGSLEDEKGGSYSSGFRLEL